MGLEDTIKRVYFSGVKVASENTTLGALLFTGLTALISTGAYSNVQDMYDILNIKNLKDIGDIINLTTGTMSNVVSALAGGITSLSYIQKRRFKSQVKEIEGAEEEYELENVETIKIDDEEGLTYLLTKTRDNADSDKRKENSQSRYGEWCTFIKAEAEEGTARVTSILDYETAKKDGLVSTPKLAASITPNMKKAKKEGYNGLHHYHPAICPEGNRVSSFLNRILEIGNYYINLPDKTVPPPNSVNFITFNTAKGPEIIGYNKRFTYLPVNEQKTELKRASQQEVLQYLNAA